MRKSWMEAADDRLCGREQAKAWALREVWREDGKKPYGLNAFVASKVWKQRAGKPKGAHPTKEAISQFFQKIDSDPDWFPGKQSDEPRGPKRLLSGPKRTAIVSAAKRLKSEGHDPGDESEGQLTRRLSWVCRPLLAGRVPVRGGSHRRPSKRAMLLKGFSSDLTRNNLTRFPI